MANKGFRKEVKISNSCNLVIVSDYVDVSNIEAEKYLTLEVGWKIILNGVRFGYEKTRIHMVILPVGNPSYSSEFKIMIFRGDEPEEAYKVTESIVYNAGSKMLKMEQSNSYKEVTLDIIDKPKTFGVNPEIAEKMFPIWKIELEQSLYGRDGGSEWADPYNDVRKTGSIKYLKRSDLNSNWTLEYSEHMGEFSYALHQSAITIERLREIDYSAPTENTCMFESDGRMFKFTHFCYDQKAICGDAIDEYIDNYSDDSSIKVDMVKSYVFTYDKNTLVMMSGKLYLNGKMVMTGKELKDKYNIEFYQAQNMYPNHVAVKLAELFPEAETYKSWGASGHMYRKPEDNNKSIKEVSDNNDK